MDDDLHAQLNVLRLLAARRKIERSAYGRMVIEPGTSVVTPDWSIEHRLVIGKSKAGWHWSTESRPLYPDEGVFTGKRQWSRPLPSKHFAEQQGGAHLVQLQVQAGKPQPEARFALTS